MLFRISSTDILCRFHYVPFLHFAVLGWWPFQTDHSNSISQRGHCGWGRLISSTMITVSHLYRCRKCTWRPVLVSALTLHPYTGQSCSPTLFGDLIPCVCGYPTEGGYPTELPSQHRTMSSGGPQTTLTPGLIHSMGTEPEASDRPGR